MSADKSAMTVLIVDDSPSMRRVIAASLEDLGFAAIIHAADGMEAWDKVRSGDVGLIICDYKMPRMSGLELLEQTRADAALKDTPFILVTSEASLDTIKTTMTQHASGYVVKPFDADVLVEKVEEVLGQRLGA